MKKPVISMGLHRGEVIISEFGEVQRRAKVTLPDGCIGIMFVFESKKKALEFDSKHALAEIEHIPAPPTSPKTN